MPLKTTMAAFCGAAAHVAPAAVSTGEIKTSSQASTPSCKSVKFGEPQSQARQDLTGDGNELQKEKEGMFFSGYIG